MNKGYDLDTARRELLRLRNAGIRFSLNIINAAGGPGRMLESAQANAKICNEVGPYLIFVSPLHVDPDQQQRDKEDLLAQLRQGKARFTPEQLSSHPEKGAEGRLRL